VRHEAAATRWFIPASRWLLIGACAAVAAALTADRYMDDSPWIGVGIALTVAVVLHTALASRVIPWFPGLAVLVALLQWVLAPWVAYHMTPLVPGFAMIVSPATYFSYAVPCALALAVGLYLPLWGPGARVAPRAARVVPAGFRLSCDGMIVVGLVARLAGMQDIPWSLSYALMLVSDLAWVGAFGLLLIRAPGWGWRLALVFLVRAALASSDAMFHDLLLWAAAAALLIAFVRQLRPATVGALAAAGLLFLGIVNEVKGNFRSLLVGSPELTLTERATALAGVLGDQVAHPLAAFTGRDWVRTVTRANQGWIIAHVESWVPIREPYADGETIAAALRSALAPRVLDPEKYVAGGTYFERFTGLPLPRSTSMNLSVAGEMYANFGPVGGVCGVLVFGLLVGSLMRRFVSLAQRSRLWWAWAPYVLLYVLQAENGVGEEVNQIVKALVAAGAVIAVVPAWRALRTWPIRLRRVRVAAA
jgi:hypothetical protein